MSRFGDNDLRRNAFSVFSMIAVCLTLICLMALPSNAFGQDTTLSQFNTNNQSRKNAKAKVVAQKIAGDQKSTDAKDPNKAVKEQIKKPAKPPAITNERRSELLTFVRENHPELLPLINSHRKKRPSYYQTVLRLLDKSVKTLAAQKKAQSPERYQQSLADWRLKSRIQLLTAHLSIKDTAQTRKQIEGLLRKQIANRERQLKADLERSQKRVDRATQLLEDLTKDRDATVKRQMDAVVKTAKRNAERARNAKKAADARVKKQNEAKKQNKTKSPNSAAGKKQGQARPGQGKSNKEKPAAKQPAAKQPADKKSENNKPENKKQSDQKNVKENGE